MELSDIETLEDLKNKYAEELRGLETPSYFLATTGNVTVDILKKYVENQRKDQE